MQRVIEPRDRADRIAERRVRGDVGDALAVEIHVAAVTQAFHILRAGERAASVGDEILGAHGSTLPCWMAPGLDRTSETQLPTDCVNPPMGQPSDGSVRRIGVIGQAALRQSQANTQPPEPGSVHKSRAPGLVPRHLTCQWIGRRGSRVQISASGRREPLGQVGTNGRHGWFADIPHRGAVDRIAPWLTTQSHAVQHSKRTGYQSDVRSCMVRHSATPARRRPARMVVSKRALISGATKRSAMCAMPRSKPPP